MTQLTQIPITQFNFGKKVISARNPCPANECTGLEGWFGVMQKIKDAIFNLVWYHRLDLYI